MRRSSRLRVFALLAATATFAGYSWITAFAVSNRSDASIQVRVRTLRPGDPAHCPFAEWGPPALTSTETMGWWRPRAEWKELALDETGVDPESCGFEIELPPRTAVRIAQVGTYTGHGSGRWGNLADLELRLTTRAGTLAFSEVELVRAFAKRSASLYELAYAAPSFED